MENDLGSKFDEIPVPGIEIITPRTDCPDDGIPVLSSDNCFAVKGILAENGKKGVFRDFRHQKPGTIPYIDGGVPCPGRIIPIAGDDDRFFFFKKAILKRMNIGQKIIDCQLVRFVDQRVITGKIRNQETADRNPSCQFVLWF